MILANVKEQVMKEGMSQTVVSIAERFFRKVKVVKVLDTGQSQHFLVDEAAINPAQMRETIQNFRGYNLMAAKQDVSGLFRRSK